MAGKRNNIASWRRVRHLAIMLCVQSAVAWVVSCGFALTVYPGWNAKFKVNRASVIGSDSTDVFPGLELPGLGFRIQGTPVQWQWPYGLPAWDSSKYSSNKWPSPSWWELRLPLWPVPVGFAWLAWYAGRRIKRLRRDVCAKCGYDTRGLAAGAVCPECGAACGGAR